MSAGDETESLEPRVMLVLVALARHAGEVLSRDRLVNLCWGGRVVTDDALQRCIGRLRKLAERFGGFDVETVRRVGYRLTIAPSASPAVVQPRAGRRPVAWRWPASLMLVAILGLVAAAAFRPDAAARREAPRDSTSLAEIASLVATDQYGAAFKLAQPLVAAGSHIAGLDELWQQIVLPTSPLIDEPGAKVWFRPYTDRDGPWIEGGTTPLRKPFAAPRGPLRLKVEKPGFRTGYFVIANPGPSTFNAVPLTVIGNPLPELSVSLPLIRSGSLPDDMVLVPHTDMPITLGGWTRNSLADHREDIPAFAIGRTEVTNREFKEFVDAGGYDDPRYWQGFEFRDGGRTLTWQEARSRLVDSTNRPGPADWQFGAYPINAGPLPVSGISWYEAMAYARFRGLMLPTIHHWIRAAQSPYDALYNTTAAIALQSRFSADGPAPAGDDIGLGPWGTLQMAGNVREWVANFAGDQAIALGGAWTEYPYPAGYTHAVPPMTRAPQYGLRLMQPPNEWRDEWSAATTLLHSDRPNLGPVSDEIFAGMRFLFTRGSGEQPERVQRETLSDTDLWSAELVDLIYAHGKKTSMVLVLPRRPQRPLQPILYGPPWGCCIANRPNREALEQLKGNEFVVNGGRALVLPIWTGSYERAETIDLFSLLQPSSASLQRTTALGYSEDAGHVLDYLATRADMDTDHVGFLGLSLGAGTIGPLLLATEPRLKTAVLISGGLNFVEFVHPMLDATNYAPRITVPVLMINGRFDQLYPYEQAQRPLFELLGTPSDRKAHVVFDVGHVDFPPNSLARITTDWFDKYLGPPGTEGYDKTAAAR
jgi:formylglycine-generating enzyme required for sulfatase activity/dienelactone hydrolase